MLQGECVCACKGVNMCVWVCVEAGRGYIWVCECAWVCGCHVNVMGEREKEK